MSDTTCIRRPHTTWTTCKCDPCARDRSRMHKRQRAGLNKRVPTEQAQAVLQQLRDAGWTAHAIASACDLHYRSIDRDMTAARIGPKIAAKIVNHGDPTEGSVGSTGTMRRLRGLARQGYDLQTIADATGIGFSTLAAIRGGTTARVKSIFYTTIRDYTETVGASIGPSEQAMKRAITKRWPGILAFDAIDDPNETADLHDPRRDDEYDEAAVIRLLSGEKVHARPADKAEATRRWVKRGGTAREFARIHGWKENRYYGGSAA